MRVVVLLGLVILSGPGLWGQATVTLDTSAAGKQQVIDGFGTCTYSGSVGSWFNNLYLNDMYCSMVRVDLTPSFVAPYSNNNVYSPAYDNAGGQGTRVRGYTGPSTYSNPFALDASHLQTTVDTPIAVMTPNIDTNVQLLSFTAPNQALAGQLAQGGQSVAGLQQLGDFKLFASFWSPQPWVKVANGDIYSSNGADALPINNPAYPFIWLGNYAGGSLDTSNTPLPQFFDGVQNTSALTQFARMVAASLRGYQNQYKVKFYAVSIQNELTFEEYYNSCVYYSASSYIAAAEAVRAELNKYSDLSAIQIEGPEDLMGGDAYSMWQYGSGNSAVDKNLQFLQNIESVPAASAAVSFYSIHGYDPDGISPAGSATSWNWWANGWTTSPAGGIPANVGGFRAYGKKSWMTETSGESNGWLDSSGSGYPDAGAFSLALKIHEALTTGQESAWVYWQFNDGTTPVDASSLTDGTSLATSPKYVAAKHFFRWIRPNSYRVNTTVSGSSTVLASSYVNDATLSLTTVLINNSAAAATAQLNVPAYPPGITSFQTFTSSNGSYWQASTSPVAGGRVNLSLPAYSVVTLAGNSPLSLIKAVSSPGTAGTLNLPLALTGTPTVECRRGATVGSYAIVLTFSQPVTSLTATLGLQAGQAGAVAGAVQTPAISGSTVTVNLTGVGDCQRLNLALTGIQPGNVSVAVPFNILWGDVNGDGAVTAADITPVRAAYGLSFGSSGFNLRADTNGDGVVSSGDLIPIKTYYGTTLP